jgi:hypothetical protein
MTSWNEEREQGVRPFSFSGRFSLRNTASFVARSLPLGAAR